MLIELLRRQGCRLDGTETVRLTAPAPLQPWREPFQVELPARALREPAGLEGVELPRGSLEGVHLSLLVDRMPLGLGLGMLARSVTWLAKGGELRVVVRDLERWLQGLVRAELDERSAGFARLQACRLEEAWGAQSLTFVLEALGLSVVGTKAYWDPTVDEPRVEVTALATEPPAPTSFRTAAALIGVLRRSSPAADRCHAWRDLVAVSGMDPLRLGGTPDEPPGVLCESTASARPTPTEPVFSVVILTYNGLADTRRCLESVEAYSSQPYELIVVDNASTDGTAAFLESWAEGRPHVKVVLNQVNRGFAGGNNEGLAVAEGVYAILLNNDTVVTEGWLEGFERAFALDSEIGLVGPRSNCVSGAQEVSDAAYVSAAQMQRFAQSWSEEHRGRYDDVTRLVGFCLGIRRSVWELIGGLDEVFGRGNYEDDDYSLRAIAAGNRIVVAHDVFIHHTGGRAFRDTDIDLAKLCGENGLRFRQKWGLPIEPLLGATLTPVFNDQSAAAVPLPVIGASHVAEGRVLRERHPAAARDELVRRAKTAQSIGHATTALFLFAEVARRYPAYLPGHMAFAAVAIGMSDARHAMMALEGACDACPDDPQLWAQLATVRWHAGEHTTAREACMRALELDPTAPTIAGLAARFGLRQAG